MGEVTAVAEALLELAARCEAAVEPSKALNREVALLTGWHRYSPSEIGKSNPGWIAPEDWIGEYERKDGRKTPRLDSLHGTDIWCEPRDFTASLDAAMGLYICVPARVPSNPREASAEALRQRAEVL